MSAPRAGTAYVAIQGDFEPLGKQLRARAGILHRTSTDLGKKIGLGITAGAAGAVTGLYKIGEAFDDSSDKIRVQTGKTGKHLAGLQKDFKAVVKTVPTDFDTASSAVAGLNQRLGLTGKPLRKLTEQMTELSRITGTDINENIASTTRLFGDWSVKTKDQSKTLDKLFRLSQHTGITISDLSRNMVAFGSPLRQLGLNFDFAASMFAEFEKNGVNTQTLMPGLRFAIKSFSGAIPKTTDELKKLGISLDNPQKALQQTMKLIKDAPNDLKANSIAFKIFGVRAGPDMAAAIREGHFQLKGLMDTMEHGHDTIRQAGKDTEDFAEKWKRFKNRTLVALEPVASRVFSSVGKDAEHLFKVLENPHLTTDEKIDRVFKQVSRLFDKIEPKLADEAARLAPRAAEAFVHSFLSAGPWGRLLITGVLLKKMGGLGAFRKLGITAGTQVGTGMAAGVAGSGLKGRLVGTFKAMAPSIAAALLVAFGPELAKKTKEGLGGQSLKFDLPKHPTEPLGSVIGPLGDIERAVEHFGDKVVGEADNALLTFGDHAEDTFKKLAKGKDSAGLAKLADQARHLAKQFPDDSRELDRFADAANKAARQSAGDFRDLSKDGGKSLRRIKTDTFNAAFDIKQDLGRGTEAGKKALSHNFYEAAQAVHKSMKAGVISTKEGTHLINQYMVKALAMYGFSPAQAINLAHGHSYIGGKEEGTGGATYGSGHGLGSIPSTNRNKRQSGGMVVPGSGSGDKVPLHAMVEPGERVFVLNRNASKKLGALQTLNAMVPRFQSGGSVTGDTDFLPGLYAALKAMSAAAGVPIFVQSGRRTVAEQLAQGPSTPGHPVAGPNGPHVRGVAADITPGRSVFGALAARFGLSFPIGVEPWHVQLMSALGSALAGAMKPEQIKRVLASGPVSPLKGLVQGALDTTRAAAQQVVNSAFNASFTNGPEGAPAGAGGFSKARLRALWVQAGGDPSMANLMAAIALAESGGDPNIVNGIGATGLWQIHPGGPQYKDPLTNARTAVSKLRSQGLGAWETYTNGAYRSFLQRGGLVGLKGGGFAAGLGRLRQNSFGLLDGEKPTAAGRFAAGLHRLPHASSPKIAKRTLGKLLDQVKAIGLPKALQGRLSKYSRNADIFGDYADRASALTTTADDGTETPGKANGKTQAQWLQDELGALFRWRNAIINAQTIIKERRAYVATLLVQARQQLGQIKRHLRRAVARQKQLKGNLDKARKALSRFRRHPKRNKHLIRITKHEIGSLASRLAGANDTVRTDTRARDSLAKLIGQGDSGLTGRAAQLKDTGSTLGGSLEDVQGIGSPTTRYKTLPALGVLGGRILDAQIQIRDLNAPQPKTTDDTSDVSDSGNDLAAQRADLLAQQNTTLAQRLAVSQAQYGVLKNFPPFGGSFDTGGTVPGPVGAPRTIIAHGGERVLSVDDLRDPSGGTVIHQHHVYLGGNELDATIDTRVVKVTRGQALAGARGARLAGRAGSLR